MYFIAYLSFNFGVGSLCIYVDGMEKQDLSAVKCMLKSFKTPTFFLFNISMVLLDLSSMILYGYFAYGLPIKYSANSLFPFLIQVYFYCRIIMESRSLKIYFPLLYLTLLIRLCMCDFCRPE